MHRHQVLLQILSDGQFHSGQDIAMELGISRTAVWKQIQTMDRYNLDIYKVRGKGYRLSSAIELLHPDTIKDALEPNCRQSIQALDILFDTDSTNQHLSQRADIHGQVVLAEYQTGGRGRRGRKWVSPFASGIYLSIGWRFDIQPQFLSTLSLATGVAVANALKSSGIDNVRLKWPNDIILNDGKLGGILLENRSELGGFSDVILGIGINYALNDKYISEIDQQVSDLDEHIHEGYSRNRLVAILLNSVFEMLKKFTINGFSDFYNEWCQYDYMVAKQVSLEMPDKTILGTVLGIDQQGMLIMDVEGQRKKFNSGELSLRLSS